MSAVDHVLLGAVSRLESGLAEDAMVFVYLLVDYLQEAWKVDALFFEGRETMCLFEVFLGGDMRAEGTDVVDILLVDEFELRHGGGLALVLGVEEGSSGGLVFM